MVLQRLADERYITQAQADQSKKKPIVTRGQPTQPPGIAPFFVEDVSLQARACQMLSGESPGWTAAQYRDGSVSKGGREADDRSCAPRATPRKPRLHAVPRRD